MPAKAGIHLRYYCHTGGSQYPVFHVAEKDWTPAFAGVTNWHDLRTLLNLVFDDGLQLPQEHHLGGFGVVGGAETVEIYPTGDTASAKVGAVP